MSSRAWRIFTAVGCSLVPKFECDKQRDPRRDAEAADLLGRKERHFGDLLGGRIEVHVGVADEDRALGHDQHVHGVVVVHAGAAAEHLVDVMQMQIVRAERAAQHAVGLAAVDRHRADAGRAPSHLDLRVLDRDAAALGEAVVLLPVLPVMGMRLDVDQLEIGAGPDAQAEALDPALDHRGTADQDRLRQALVDHDLHRAQHALVLALGIDDGTRRVLGRSEQRLHDEAGVVDELLERVAVRAEILDRARGDARIHRRSCDRGRDLHDQPRVERLRDQIFGPEAQVLLAVCRRDDVRLLGRGEVGDRLHRSDLHRLVDRRRADIERPAEDERKAEDVVDLVRVVRTAGSDDRIRPRLLGQIGEDFGLGIREGEDERVCRHLLHHLGLQHAARGEAEEHVGTLDDLAQRAGIGLAGVTRLVRVHLRLPVVVDDAGDVGHPDVLPPQAEPDQQIETGERRGAGARDDELHLPDVLADDAQAVGHRGADDDGRAVLVVVEHRDLHPLAALALDVEALRRLDVLEIDAAEGGLERDDDVDELVGIALVHLQVEDVDPGELLEQHALAFHHRLPGERTDVAEAEDRGAVRDHRHQVRARS